MDSRENAPLCPSQMTPAGTRGMGVNSDPPNLPQSPFWAPMDVGQQARSESPRDPSTQMPTAFLGDSEIAKRRQSVTGFDFAFLNPFLSPRHRYA